MYASVLTKDQWWFILLTTAFQALVTVAAVALGAYWALSRDRENRRRTRGEELAISAASTLDTIMLELRAVRRGALQHTEIDQTTLGLRAAYLHSETAAERATADLTLPSLYLDDERLRAALTTLPRCASSLLLITGAARSDTRLADEVLRYSNAVLIFARELRLSLSAYVRGGSFSIPDDPGDPDYDQSL